MSNEKIIEKIQKLLALSGSENKHEAELSMKKAQDLMTKHNLNMQAIDNHDSEYIGEKGEYYNRESIEAKYINSILSEFFFVSVIRSSKLEGKFITIVGEKNNVKTAQHMKVYLTNVFKVLWAEYKTKTGCSVKSKQSFYMGLYRGFSEKMKEQRAETEQKFEMVLVKDINVENKVMELFGKTTSTQRRVSNTGDGKAMSEGKKQGKNLNINSGALTA